MRRIVQAASSLLMVLLLLGCEVNPEPPKFSIMATPDDKVTRPGGTIEVACGRAFHINNEKEEYAFKATYESKCKIKQLENKGHTVKLQIDENCLEGDVKIKIEATGKGGVTTKDVTFKVKRKLLIWEVLPPRPEKIPAAWMMVDDFEKEGKLNATGGFRGNWTYRNGKCKFSFVKDKVDGSGVLRIDFKLPFKELSSCGYYEYFKGAEEGKSEKFDLSEYKEVTFMIKSGDDTIHKMRFELIEWSEFAQYKQGPVAVTDEVVVATKFWRRVVIPFAHFAKHIKVNSLKSLSIKMDSVDKNVKEGVILIDNLAFIKK